MKLLIAISFLFVSPVYAADFSGTWKGNGTYESSSWGSFQSQVEIEIVQSQNQLSARDCWAFVKDGANWHVCSENQFELKGSEIWYNGFLVGRINGDSLEISFSDSGYSIVNKVKINLNQTLDYTYEARHSEGRFVKTVASGLVQ